MHTYNWLQRTLMLEFPSTAFHAGYDTDGSDMFIGKAAHGKDFLPAKLVPSRDGCYITSEGIEVQKDDYWVLVGEHLRWVSSSEGVVPRRAVVGGETVEGEIFYIGRVYHLRGHCVGKVDLNKKVCLFPYNGRELYCKNYEILVEGEVHYWTDNLKSAFLAGVDADGDKIFIGKVQHEGDLLPAMMVPSKGIAYISYDGKAYEKPVDDAAKEVLCGYDLKWVAASEGQVPRKSVRGGETSEREKLYIGRVDYLGSTYIGKVQPSKRCCYIPYDSEEISFENYEILVDADGIANDTFPC